MTAPTATLATVPDAALQLAKGGNFSVADLADAVVPPEADPKVPDFPALPKPVQLTDKARTALGQISKLFGGFQLTERRPLTDKELVQLTDEASVITEAAKPLAARIEVIAEMLRVHMDAQTEQSAGRLGRVVRSVPRILSGKAKGHYLLAGAASPYKVSVPGYEQCWEQRYVSGSAVTDPAKLLELYEAEEITREEYLALTREQRVYDEDKVAAFVRKHPARGLEILAAITTRKDPGAQLVSPKK